MSYLGRSAKLSLKAQEKVSFLATAGQTVKTGLSYTPSFIEVYVNGVLLTDTTDFTATNGNSITFTVALLLNDEVTVISLKTFTVADHLPKSGGTMTGDTAHGDNVKSKFGNSDDLQIYHDGSASRIVDSGTGGLALQADANVVIQNSAGTETKAEFTTDGGVNLYHDNAAKFSTTATGVETQGRVMLSGADNHLRFNGNSSTPLGECIHRPAAANIAIVTGSAERMRIDSAGIVTKPYQPAFSATKSGGNQTSIGDIVFNTVQTNVGSHYNNSNGRFTAPVAGQYYFSIFMMSSNDATALDISLYKNGSLYHALSPYFGDGPQYTQVSGSAVSTLAVNDYVYFYLTATGSAHAYGTGPSGKHSNFSGYLIG